MAASYISNRKSNASFFGASMLSGFLSWWGRELVSLVPNSLRILPPSTRKYVWVECDTKQVVLRKIDKQGLQEIGRIDLAGQDQTAHKLAFNALMRQYRRSPLGLAVAGDQILRKSLQLPLAAKENLRQVLSFELGRYTPFGADQAWFDYKENSASNIKGLLDIDLTVASRRQVEECTNLLRGWGWSLHAVVPADELLNELRYANLLPPLLRPRMGWGYKFFLGLALMLSLLLTALALAIPLWQKREVAIALIAQVGEAKKSTFVIDGLRAELDAATNEHHYLLEKKHKRPASVSVLNEVTRLLPDDTWLTQLEIKGEDVVLSGETNSSSSLIRLFERSTQMGDAAYRSPLIKARNNVERFQLSAKLKEASFDAAISGESKPSPKISAGVLER